jgi:two-component system, OmpR family, sensor histidine kinase KdpD
MIDQPTRSKIADMERLWAAIARSAVCAGLLSLIVFVYLKPLQVNPTTVALSFLLAILSVAATWGLRYALPMSVAAALAFNFFFLPPIGTFAIADKQDWVTLFAFLFTSVVTSNLSERARRQTQEANRRRREAETLYTFSQQLLVTENIIHLLQQIPRYVAETFAVSEAVLYIADKDQTYRSNPDRGQLPTELLRETIVHDDVVIDWQQHRCLVPLRIGVRAVGALGMTGEPLSRETLEAMSNLTAISIERAGAIESLARTEAAREGECLRSALLDTVTHEFRAPLNSIQASVETLRKEPQLTRAQRDDLLVVIEEQKDRLDRVVREAVEMAQLDTSEVMLNMRPHTISAAIDEALEHAKLAIDGHPVEVRLPDHLPAVAMDIDRVRKALQHLLENAAKYSPAGSPIFISCEAQGDRLIISIADRGAGISDLDRSMIFCKFYRGQGQPQHIHGAGLGLAIVKAVVEAHGGHIEVTSQPGQGSVFSFDLPLANDPLIML